MIQLSGFEIPSEHLGLVDQFKSLYTGSEGLAVVPWSSGHFVGVANSRDLRVLDDLLVYMNSKCDFWVTSYSVCEINGTN